MAKKEKIIMGIDPGTNNMGYGLIRVQGNAVSLVTLGVLKLSQLSDPAVKLRRIFERTLSIINEFHPDEMAFEAPFYGKNVQSMLKLGRAQGVAMAAGLYRDIPVFEYSPRKIKQSTTGNGSASKEQVAEMVQRLLNFRERPEFLDATDAVAVALCHFFQKESPQGLGGSSQKGGWDQFLKNNPDRIRK